MAHAFPILVSWLRQHSLKEPIPQLRIRSFLISHSYSIPQRSRDTSCHSLLIAKSSSFCQMDASALEQQMLAAAIAASLEDYQKRSSTASSHQASFSNNDIENSRILPKEKPETQSSNMSPQRTYKVSSPAKGKVVDLTNDSSSDSDVKEIFPYSQSIVNSDAEDESFQGISGDASDEELKQAIAMSLETSQQATDHPAHLQIRGSCNDPSIPSTGVSHIRGIFGVDRKQMEQERLTRLAKRKAGVSPPPSQPASKTARITDPRAIITPRAPAADSGVSERTFENQTRISSFKKPISPPQPSPRSDIQFPQGVVKKTYVAFVPRSDNDITIEEVIQKNDLNVAVLSSFLWDMDWLFSKFDAKKTKFILMMGAKEEETVSMTIALHYHIGNRSTILRLHSANNIGKRLPRCPIWTYVFRPWNRKSIICTQN